MAGSTLTVTKMSNPYGDRNMPNRITLDWLSDDTNGDLSKDIDAKFATPHITFEGWFIVGIETIPGENGDLTTDLPDDQYDLELHSPYDADLAGGSVKNRSGTIAQRESPYVLLPIDSEITIEIDNAGNSKKGRIILHLSPRI